MCEFKVMINGKTVFKDAVYAKSDGNRIIVKDILGDIKEFQNYKITELNINTQQLILLAIKP
jgi:predicted RNA-binding protein